jgi:DNA-binding PadR family transcriptional regulator
MAGVVFRIVHDISLSISKHRDIGVHMHTNHQATRRSWYGHGHGRGFGPRGRGPGFGRRRRGDTRTAILAVLAEGPGHGYDIIGRLEEKSGGAWRPSAGSVYPTLQQLEDEGLATSAETEGKRVYTITDAGVEEAARRVAEAGAELWAFGRDGGMHPGHLFRSIGALGLAARQVVHAGTPEQLAKVVEIIDSARREVYRLLADEPTRTSDTADGDTAADPA